MIIRLWQRENSIVIKSWRSHNDVTITSNKVTKECDKIYTNKRSNTHTQTCTHTHTLTHTLTQHTQYTDNGHTHSIRTTDTHHTCHHGYEMADSAAEIAVIWWQELGEKDEIGERMDEMKEEKDEIGEEQDEMRIKLIDAYTIIENDVNVMWMWCEDDVKIMWILCDGWHVYSSL